ncbi:hypothetical protein [Pedobacter sandarakinus]|uniref:hypothetical protein n=1 Tax=Pedobacter sandarakinus TaxID=353156 RepID=UPI002245CFD9|nr:hypothetical protein [Pedobacter sandarakinus]MCX2574115.1 hypothetical protein [Pedobacter sandarakinus]
MKNFIVLLLLIVCGNIGRGQENPSQHYLFPDFREGTISYKSGSPNQAKLNYNRLTHEMVFVNKGSMLALYDTNIDTIYLENKKFVLDQDRFLEVFAVKNRLIYIDHTASYIPPAANAGMGGTSQTAGQNSVANVKLISGIYNLSLPNYRIIPADDLYFKSDAGLIRLNVKNLEKQYPNKSKEIKKLIRERNLSLEKLNDLREVFDILD